MRRDGGFTLLEILVALAVLGLLLASLSQGVAFGLRAWQIEAREVGARNDLEAVERTIRLLVHRTLPDDAVPNRGTLVGGPGLLDLVTALPPPPSPVAIRTAVVRLEVDAAHRLVLHSAPFLHAATLSGPGLVGTAVLLEGVERIEFAYWQEVTGGGGAWQRAWSKPSPPSLVRLRIVFPRGDARHWPDVVIATPRQHASSSFLRLVAESRLPIRA
jgi:general secretion pathway protein J